MNTISNDYTVYMHIAPNGKKYVGITSNDVKKRWGHGCGYKTNKHFANAIQKYGWDNIAHRVLKTGLNREEACSMEKYLIALFQTNKQTYGYNQTTGGEYGYEFTEDVKNKLSKPKRLSNEQREKLKERGRMAYEKYLKGCVRTPESIQKMADSKRGKKQDPDVVKRRAEAIKKAYAIKGVSEEHREKLSKALKGRKFSSEHIQKIKECNAPDKNARSRKVVQIDNGVIVAEYCSTREAQRQTGINYTSIVRACAGKRLKHAGGFEWRYK